MAEQSISAGLSRPGQQLNQGSVDELFLDTYGGLIEGTIIKKSKFQDFIDWRSVTGTDTITNYRNGNTSLQKLNAGDSPQPVPVEFDKVSVKVDTVMLARNSVWTLDEIQSKFSAKAALAREQGGALAKFIDNVVLTKAVKAARIIKGDGTGGTTKLPAGWFGGTIVDLDNANDETNPLLLQAALEDAVTGIREKDIDTEDEDFIIVVRPAQYLALARNDKLIDRDFNMGNGEYSKRTVLKSNGIPVIESNRLPSAAVTGHPLSNEGNNNAYDLSATEAKCVAVIFSPRAILAGTSIPLTSNVWWNEHNKTWMIDSWIALGATENNPAYAAVVNKA